MKDIVNFINEHKEDLKHFRIDDLKQELINNEVSKTRINEIIEYFKTILGEGSYYCISPNNPENKKLNFSCIKGEFTLKNLFNVDDFSDKEWIQKLNNKIQQHNDEFNGLDKELQNKINKLDNSIVGLKLNKKFKFGKTGKGCTVELIGGICKFDNNYVPCIMQIQPEAYVTYTNITFYFNTKDID